MSRRLVLAPFSVALARPLGAAARPVRRREGLIVRIEADGEIGQGEASPLPGPSPDTLAEAGAQLERVDAGAVLEALEQGDTPAAALAAALDHARLEAPSARCGLETALWDLLGRRQGLPAHRLLGGHRAPRPVPVNGLLPVGDVDETLAAARAWLERGVGALKLKVGGPDGLGADVARLRALRAALDPRVELRLDANGAWTRQQARAALTELAAFAPRYVEQPVPPAVLETLGPVPLPIAADESLAWPGALERLVALGLCQVAIVKPMVLGGALASLHLAALARRLGVEVVVTHLLSGPIGHAAACELALALDPAPAACGLAEHAGLAGWEARPPQLAAHAVVPVDRPGLGLPPLGSPP